MWQQGTRQPSRQNVVHKQPNQQQQMQRQQQNQPRRMTAKEVVDMFMKGPPTGERISSSEGLEESRGVGPREGLVGREESRERVSEGGISRGAELEEVRENSPIRRGQTAWDEPSGRAPGSGHVGDEELNESRPISTGRAGSEERREKVPDEGYVPRVKGFPAVHMDDQRGREGGREEGSGGRAGGTRGGTTLEEERCMEAGQERGQQGSMQQVGRWRSARGQPNGQQHATTREAWRRGQQGGEASEGDVVTSQAGPEVGGEEGERNTHWFRGGAGRTERGAAMAGAQEGGEGEESCRAEIRNRAERREGLPDGRLLRQQSKDARGDGDRAETQPWQGDGVALMNGGSDVDGISKSDDTSPAVLPSQDELRAARSAWMALLQRCAVEGRAATARDCLADMIASGFQPPPAAFNAAMRAILTGRGRGRGEIEERKENRESGDGCDDVEQGGGREASRELNGMPRSGGEGRVMGAYDVRDDGAGRTLGHSMQREGESEKRSEDEVEESRVHVAPSPADVRRGALGSEKFASPSPPNNRNNKRDALRPLHDQVREVHLLMEAHGVCPNKQSRLLLVEAYLRDGLVDEGNAVLEEMREAEISVPHYIQRMAIRRWAAAGRAAEAEQAVKDLIADGGELGVGIVNAVFEMYVRVKAWVKAEDVYSGMESLGLERDERTFSTAVHM